MRLLSSRDEPPGSVRPSGSGVPSRRSRAVARCAATLAVVVLAVALSLVALRQGSGSLPRPIALPDGATVEAGAPFHVVELAGPTRLGPGASTTDGTAPVAGSGAPVPPPGADPTAPDPGRATAPGGGAPASTDPRSGANGPAVSVPGVSVPGVSVPPTVPGVTVPGVSVPTVSIPGVSVPPVSVPGVPVPTVSLPGVSLPPVTLPPVTLPGGVPLGPVDDGR